MQYCLMVGLAMLMASDCVAGADDDVAKISQQLQGEWEATEIEIQGKKGSEETVKAFRIIFNGDQVTVKTNSAPGRKSTLKLNPAKVPNEMDLKALERVEKGQTQHCIFSLDSEKLQLCAPLSGDKRPTEFATKPGDGFVLVVLKRVNPK